MLTLLLTALLVAPPQEVLVQEPEEWKKMFRRPKRQFSPDGLRIHPNPKWITTTWSSAADKPYEAIMREAADYKVFRGFERTNQWASKARTAYQAWHKDHQDPVKLFRAALYFAIANEVSLEHGTAKDHKDMALDLNLGFEVLESPPKSYLFVRMAYIWSAGDGDRHLYGDLAEHLLKRNPLDRSVAFAAVREWWDERSGPTKKTLDFERLVIDTLHRLSKTELWRPWDDRHLAQAYMIRALRLNDRATMNRAIEYMDSALAKTPKEMDLSSLREGRAILVRLRDRMPNK